jgi:hypothetical protein
MQRVISAFTLCLYVVLTVGLSFHTHYCMGREVSHSLLPRTCPPSCKKSCCQDSVTTYRLAEKHVVADASITLSAPAASSPWALSQPLALTVEAVPLSDEAYRRYSSSPPLPPAVPRYVRFLSLVFYA